jgi:hypothetical protein
MILRREIFKMVGIETKKMKRKREILDNINKVRIGVIFEKNINFYFLN